MTKQSKRWWDRFLFRDKGFLPTKKLLVAFTGLSIFLIGGVFLGLTWPWIIALLMLAFILSLFDFLWLPSKKEIDIQRKLLDKLERNIDYEVELTIVNKGKQPVIYEIIDGLPQSFERPFPLRGKVNNESKTKITYQTKAPIRGDYDIDSIYIRCRSVLGLWKRQMVLLRENKVKVIPDITDMKEYLENAQRYLTDEGIIIKKQVSGVGEFSKVRNYVVGDDPRMINWRQTAKLREVMSNEYEPEHGKYITILIDCGRMMGTELRKGNRLERALEASLTLAAAALQKGDYVSILAFSKSVKVYIPPAKGMAQLQTILDEIYNLKVEASESNYGEVFQYLQRVQKKRSLILLMSDVRTFLYEEMALIYLTNVRRRHRFLMLGIVDETLIQYTKLHPDTVQKAMVKSMAEQQTLFKKKEKSKWEKQGLEMKEVEEENLSVAAVSSYIQMLNRGLI
ncbi:DUF58 domain-containing protein [Alkalihalobacillus trypoxylicola]|uniref:DUF58 domain-containing protein n=1 Tax=Alkalihalobacillus trypoxylicola TaxID=519424 RepID=A0A162EZ79_9BACI|nr:DUF58 domain-containing protein [Alkalihalobacillus trypoxylicola]KYG34092.1 hypothetical protein AZF04_14775 [Alkalihalobacillus trypoxylicola]